MFDSEKRKINQRHRTVLTYFYDHGDLPLYYVKEKEKKKRRKKERMVMRLVSASRAWRGGTAHVIT